MLSPVAMWTWDFAMNSRSAVMDASEAVTIARETSEFATDWRARMYLQTLTAAHAAVGEFHIAIQVQRSALEFAVTRAANREVKDGLFQLESLRASSRGGT